MELIRILLKKYENEEDPEELAEYTPQQQLHHICLLIDAGLVDGSFIRDSEGVPCDANVVRLTWSGHDFLSATKNRTIWEKARNQILNSGRAFTYDLLVAWLKKEIGIDLL